MDQSFACGFSLELNYLIKMRLTENGGMFTL